MDSRHAFDLYTYQGTEVALPEPLFHCYLPWLLGQRYEKKLLKDVVWMCMNTNRKQGLRNDIIELYAQGKNFAYGSLVYEYNTATVDQNVAITALKKEYSNDMELFALGFEYGYSSFLDCLIGKNRCYRESLKNEEIPKQVCVFILFCNYKNIFVLGEHEYIDESGFTLPALHAVDHFTTNRTSSLASSIHKLLESGVYQRVYAAELDSKIPDSIKTESNLVGEYPLVFDGYFNWTD